MLNTEHFIRLAGETGHWDAELLERVEAGESLPAVQEDQYRRGFRSATVVPVQGGWTPRATHPALADHFDPGEPPMPAQGILRWAQVWANHECEVIIRKDDHERLVKPV